MAKKDNVPAEGLVARNKKIKNGENTPGAPAKVKYEYILKNKKARTETKHKKLVTTLSIVLVILIVAGGIIYGMLTAIKLNSFKVYVDTPGKKVLSLSADKDFSFGTETLEIDGPGFMDNTTLPARYNNSTSTAIEDRLSLIVGSQNFEYKPTDSFIAASFSLKNMTGEDQYYAERLNLRKSTNNVDSAMRVMLVRKYDDSDEFEVVVYAKARDGMLEKVVPLEKNVYTPLRIYEKEDGTVEWEHVGEEPWMAEDFHSDEFVFFNQGKPIRAGEVIRYSIIVWLEGWDSDCTDDKLQGIIQMDLAFVQQSE